MSKISFIPEETLVITVNRKRKPVRISEIEYVESVGRTLIFHTKQGDLTFYSKMTDILPILSGRGFVRTHQSFMVQSSEILYITKNSVVTKGKAELPLSRKYFYEIREKYGKSGRGGQHGKYNNSDARRREPLELRLPGRTGYITIMLAKHGG